MKIVKAYLANQGRKPRDLVAIQKWLGVDPAFPQGIIHSITYLNDNYVSRL